MNAESSDNLVKLAGVAELIDIYVNLIIDDQIRSPKSTSEGPLESSLAR